MNQDVQQAIESARTVDRGSIAIHDATPQRRRSFNAVRAIVLAVVRELPSEMTVAELCDELEIANAQAIRG